jgi:hypothetical protein
MNYSGRPTKLTRRESLRLLAGGAAYGAVAARGLGCAPASRGPAELFDVLDVGGSYREIGHAVGATFRDRIHAALKDQESFGEVLELIRGPLGGRLNSLLEASRSFAPHLVDELAGMAEGAGIAFTELFAWNCRAELRGAADPCEPGCSTVARADERGFVLAHNEDGAAAYHGRMFVLRARPPSRIPFLYLVYPGTLVGNGPGMNARGIVQATNYLAPCEVPEGIPRYVLSRAIAEAENLEHAIALATTEGRAFPFHHNLASLPEGRLVSLETWPGRHSSVEVEGVQRHTNNLLHADMLGLPEREDYLERSSLPRLRALDRMIAETPEPGRDDLTAMLRDHSGTPCRVCRHPGDEVPGVTLAAAIFESPRLEMTLIDGPPCGGASTVVEPPAIFA